MNGRRSSPGAVLNHFIVALVSRAAACQYLGISSASVGELMGDADDAAPLTKAVIETLEEAYKRLHNECPHCGSRSAAINGGVVGLYDTSI